MEVSTALDAGYRFASGSPLYQLAPVVVRSDRMSEHRLPWEPGNAMLPVSRVGLLQGPSTWSHPVIGKRLCERIERLVVSCRVGGNER